MRIFISMPDETGANKTTRISILNCYDTSQLIRQICKQLKINKNMYIFRLKNEIIHLRILQSWPLAIYNIKNGSWIILQQTQMHHIKQSTLSSQVLLQKIEQNEQQIQSGSIQNNSFTQSSKNSFQSKKSDQDYHDYYERQLNKMLNFVREGSLSKIATLLKQEPSDIENQSEREKIYQQKNKYILNEVGQCGRNALHWAIHINSLEIVTFLLIKTSDPTIQTIDEYTPLQLAVVHRNLEIVKVLLSQNKVDPNKMTVHGSALHLAAYHQSPQLIRMLLQYNASPQQPDRDEKLPIQLSQIKQIKQVFQDHEKKLQLRLLKPNIVKGGVLKISSLTFRGKQRVLLVNPFKGDMIFYKQNESVDHKLKLSSITSLQKIRQKSWLMDDKTNYLKIIYTNEGQQNKLIIGLKHKQIFNEWISSLEMARTYVNNKKYVSKIQTQMQLVQLMDDVRNEIKIHKRQAPSIKSSSAKSKFSFFDLQVSQDQQIKEIKNKINIEQKGKPKVENYNNSSFTSNDGSDFRMSELLLGSIIDFNSFDSPPGRSSIKFEGNNQTEGPIQETVSKDQEIRSAPNFRKQSSESKVNQFVIDRQQPKRQKKSQKQKFSFSNFQFKRLLGSGAFGQVYLTRHKKTDKLYAMKVLNKKKLMAKKHLKYAVSQTNILKKIQHPFIIGLHYSFQTPTNLYLALDYCPYGDLSEILCDKQRLSESTARFLIAQAILAIQYLHSHKIIYRDLKPENILLAQDGYIKIIDFGLSKENNYASSFCGSPAYLSPEMLDKKGHSFPTDIYGLGCVLYEMIIGQPPYFDDNMEQLFDNIKNARLKFPGYVTKQIRSLLSRMLQRDVTRRIGSKGMKQLKDHEFFKGFNWDAILQKKIAPPKDIFPESIETEYFKLDATIQNDDNLKYMDQQYTETSMFNRIKGFSFSRQDQS